MRVLGVSGRDRDAAAAVAVDGRIVAAAAEESLARVPHVGYRQTGGFPGSAAAACLTAAGLTLSSIDALAVVTDANGSDDDPQLMRRLLGIGGEVPVHAVDAVQADAVQAAALMPDAAVLVCSTSPASITSFVPHEGALRLDQQVSGSGQLGRAAASLARALGVPDDDPYGALDALSTGAEPEYLDEMAAVATWQDGAGVVVDGSRLQALLAHAGGDALAEASSLNVRVQESRRALAASFTCSVAGLVRDLTERIRTRARTDTVAFGGGMFANARLNAELRRLVGDDLPFAIVPEASGRALGAVMAVSGTSNALPGLALGPAYSDHEIKRTLDNCRLDYVYEPDWQRILQRMSRLLSQGKVVAWFQGAMAFGPRAMGTRSVLCDPSSRYARHNVNEYLRHVPLDTPLPFVFAPSAIARCLKGHTGSPFSVRDADIASEWRDRLSGGLDARQRARVHTLGAHQAPELCDLLEYHYASTGVPALIETNLGAPGEPVACSPRDAVKTVYSSAIDAVALGRFVLMKDYWLLRSHGE